MKIFIICSVRGASEEYRRKLETHVAKLESQGHKVHLPHRDTNQNANGITICRQNMQAIKDSDYVHVFYSGKSQGAHFDLGVAFALHKPLYVIESEELPDGKSFSRMIKEWESEDRARETANVGTNHGLGK